MNPEISHQREEINCITEPAAVNWGLYHTVRGFSPGKGGGESLYVKQGRGGSVVTVVCVMLSPSCFLQATYCNDLIADR